MLSWPISPYVYSHLTGRSLKARDYGEDNNMHDIPPELPVTVSHILVGLMYCNTNKLQNEYKKFGCRSIKQDEDLEEIKKRNTHIAHWYKLLYEFIYFYGSKAKPADLFYTGINIPVIFGSYCPQFMCPFSTTTDWNVANRFCEGLGIILSLQAVPGSFDAYMDMEWLSDYPEERERLFFTARAMNIYDIESFGEGTMESNRVCVAAFSLWSSLFCGHYFNTQLRGKEREKTQTILTHLIRNYNEHNGIKSNVNVQGIGFPIYTQQLFYRLVAALDRERVYIIYTEFVLLKEALQNELLRIEYKENVESNEDQYQVSLSPFLESLTRAANIAILEQFIWVLSEKEFETLKAGNADELVTSKEFVYNLRNGVDVKFVFGICRCVAGSQQSGFDLEITDLSLSNVRGVFSIAVDDVNYVKNGWPVRGLSKGESKCVFFFEDALLDTLDSLTLRVALYFE